MLLKKTILKKGGPENGPIFPLPPLLCNCITQVLGWSPEQSGEHWGTLENISESVSAECSEEHRHGWVYFP